MADERALSALHFALMRGLLEEGCCPSNCELAGTLGVSPAQIETDLESLAAIHGVVLHPHVREPWVIHPFAVLPTIHLIEGSGKNWWAPCLWCAFGVAALVRGEVSIHSRIGAESEAIVIVVRDGQPVDHPDLFVHFAIAPARAWDNVHQHCSMVLPFRSVAEIDDWCGRHGLPRGEAVPLPQAAMLASTWYGTHADPNWRKWSVSEAQEIFHRVGLRSAFWDLGAKSGKF